MAKFKVRARTVDMLGRQQIAGIPTAIHELFKNAYDAYAEHVDVDYYRTDGLFVLRDDGFGMTREDYEGRWLTLGTESKLEIKGGIAPPPFQGLVIAGKSRPILGEKGIGRLAIAAIGPQVLVLTRAKLKKAPLVMSFINWGLFELPGIDIDRVEIPIAEFAGNEFPTKKDIAKLVKTVRTNLSKLSKETDPKLVARIRDELDTFDVDLRARDEVLEQPSLKDGAHGTHFFIMPADTLIQNDIDGDDPDDASPLEKSLLGFSNSMVPRHEELPIRAEFRDYHEDATVKELIGPQNFLTTEDFERADHHFSGRFDAKGNFAGTVSIYGEKLKPYKLKWTKSDGKSTTCGPFSIDFAVLPGQARFSKVPKDQWFRLNKKLAKLGGMYVYKNGIRILPYGDADFDFLEIEKRRSKHAAYYFFSHRRMFGAISTTAQDNPELSEKAGREGFRKNTAYRQFRSILIEFLLATARDFFRDEGEYADVYIRVRRDLERTDKIRKQKQKERRQAQDRLNRELESFFFRLHKSEQIENVLALKDKASKRIDKLRMSKEGERELGLEKLIQWFDSEVASLRRKNLIEKPKGVGLTKSLRREFAAYEEEIETLEKTVFKPCVLWFDKEIEKLQKPETKPKDKKKIGPKKSEAQAIVDALINEGISGLRDSAESARRSGDTLTEDFRKELSGILGDARKTLARISDKHIQKTESWLRLLQFKRRLSEDIDHSLRDYQDRVSGLNASIDQFRNMLSRGEYNPSELTEAMEEQIEDLTEEIDESVELIQMGRAIGVVHHEFQSTIRSIRQGIEKLEPWAEQHPDLMKLFNSIHANFDHLYGYLTLFDPLSRRLNPKKTEITGNDIFEFISNLFREIFQKNHIDFSVTRAFKTKKVQGYTSTFYPCFVNLIDNAVYWLSEYTEDNRQISLEAHKRGFIVADNGPGVEPRYKNQIFEFGFTRKTVGRGMGLYICREALKREDYGLELLESKPDKRTAFLIDLDPPGEDN